MTMTPLSSGNPPGAAAGEVWVRTDPRIDAELGNWA